MKPKFILDYRLKISDLIENGFTLIELLIVVAIIAIISTIAIVNYQHAQIRSKVAKSKAEMQTIATGLEAYYADNNAYPRWSEVAEEIPPLGLDAPPVSWRLRPLTTPISYISTIPGPDPFLPSIDVVGLGDKNVYDTYDYLDAQSSAEARGLDNPRIGYCIYGRMWRLSSCGPDRLQSYGRSDYFGFWPSITWTSYGFYDPTNGIVSNGDIVRLGAQSQYYTEWQIAFEPP
jgi:prepilin-type N-terminal cleavage/methylation domain-containing protein